jgi:hypothetical protein
MNDCDGCPHKSPEHCPCETVEVIEVETLPVIGEKPWLYEKQSVEIEYMRGGSKVTLRRTSQTMRRG